MAAVVEKLKSADATRGSRMVIKLPGHGSGFNFQYLANANDSGHNPNKAELDNKYDYRLDDPTYYTA
jgi:hypothetical protein